MLAGPSVPTATGMPRSSIFCTGAIPLASLVFEPGFVTGLAKLREKDASAVGADQVLKMAVSEGARCCGLDDCDCLAEGKLADLVMIDLHRPQHLAPSDTAILRT